MDVRGLRMTREYPTTLAFVQLTPEGDRSFTFYRKPGADVMLAPAEVDRRCCGTAVSFILVLFR